MYIYIFACIHTRIIVRVYVYMYVYIYIYIYVFIRMYTHILIFMYVLHICMCNTYTLTIPCWLHTYVDEYKNTNLARAANREYRSKSLGWPTPAMKNSCWRPTRCCRGLAHAHCIPHRKRKRAKASKEKNRERLRESQSWCKHKSTSTCLHVSCVHTHTPMLVTPKLNVSQAGCVSLHTHQTHTFHHPSLPVLIDDEDHFARYSARIDEVENY